MIGRARAVRDRSRLPDHELLYSLSSLGAPSMKVVVASVGIVTTALAFTVGTVTGSRVPERLHRAPVPPVPISRLPLSASSGHGSRNPASRFPLPHSRNPAPRISNAALTGVVQRYCQTCHSDAAP